MKFTATDLAGVWVVDLELLEDERGFFARTYCEKEFAERGLNTAWRQGNASLTKKRGMIRGLHFQKDPSPEIKLVRCVAGEVYDVVVDLRRDSATAGQWRAFELSAENHRAIYIPAGCAHGFQCLTDSCEMHYQMSDFYRPELSAGVRWNDPALSITWPVAEPVLSKRDGELPLLAELS